MEMKFRWVRYSAHPYSKDIISIHRIFNHALWNGHVHCSLERVILLVIYVPSENKEGSYVDTQSQQRNVSVGEKAVSLCAGSFTEILIRTNELVSLCYFHCRASTYRVLSSCQSKC